MKKLEIISSTKHNDRTLVMEAEQMQYILASCILTMNALFENSAAVNKLVEDYSDTFLVPAHIAGVQASFYETEARLKEKEFLLQQEQKSKQNNISQKEIIVRLLVDISNCLRLFVPLQISCSFFFSYYKSAREISNQQSQLINKNNKKNQY